MIGGSFVTSLIPFTVAILYSEDLEDNEVDSDKEGVYSLLEDELAEPIQGKDRHLRLKKRVQHSGYKI